MMGEEEGQWIKGKEEVGIEIPHQQNLRQWKVRSDQISSVCGELWGVILEMWGKQWTFTWSPNNDKTKKKR